jgi:hypothetical protein
MTARAIAFLIIYTLLPATAVRAQQSDSTVPQGRVQVTAIPAGVTYFSGGSETDEPSFTHYELGGAVTININRHFALEGEVTSSIGAAQDFEASTFTEDLEAPHVLQYAGNVIFYAPTGTSVTPYVTGGAGALTFFERPELGIYDTTSFFAGNVGGGLKWYADRRWGVRVDYRFLAVRSNDIDVPSDTRVRAPFFGRETRFGHRVYGGIIIRLR